MPSLRAILIILAVAFSLLICHLLSPLLVFLPPSVSRPLAKIVRSMQPVASPNEDLFEFITKRTCPIRYSDGPFKYCFREIQALAETLPPDSGPWTLDRLVEEHFKQSAPCPPPTGRQTSNGILAYWPEAGEPQCYEIKNGRLLLIGASRRPEAGWFLGNELDSTAGAEAAEALTQFYSDLHSCCAGNPESCPISAGSSECYQLFPAQRWWEENKVELSRYESWRQELLRKAGYTLEEYNARSKIPR